MNAIAKTSAVVNTIEKCDNDGASARVVAARASEGSFVCFRFLTNPTKHHILGCFGHYFGQVGRDAMHHVFDKK